MSHVRKIVRTDASGRDSVRYQARWTDPRTGRPRARRFTSEKAARAWLRRVEVAVATGEPLDPEPTSTTLAEWLNAWIDDTVVARLASGTYSPTTAATHETYVRVHLVPRLGHIPLAQLTVDDVERRLMDRMIAEGLSAGTARKARSTLSRALTDAVRRQRIPVNVAQQAEPPTLDTREPSAFTGAELGRIIAAWDGRPYAPLFEFILYTGLRISEAIGLRWSDVDLDAGSYTVARGLHVVSRKSADRLGIVDHRHAESTGKTPASRAKTSLSAAAVQLLTEHRTAQVQARLAAPAWTDPDLVFPSTVGTSLSPDNVRRTWRTILADAKVTPERDGRLRGPHELRRTFVTRLRDAGVPLEDAQRLGRWSSARVLLATYAASSDERLREAAEAAARGIREA